MKRFAVLAAASALLLLLTCYHASAAETDTQVFDNLTDYQDYVQTNGLPDRYLRASSLAILGDLRRASIGSQCRYDLVDINGFLFSITMDTRTETLVAYGRPLLNAVPKNTVSMSKLQNVDFDTPFTYVRNGVYYTFYSDGTLYCIEWYSDGVYFQISDFTDPYPMSGKDTIMKRILSASDSEATAAFDELADYARIDIDPELAWPGWFVPALILVILTAGTALTLHIIKKKREREAHDPDFSWS